MSKINQNLSMIIIFILLIIVMMVFFSRTSNKRCCEFEDSEISGVVYRTSFSKSGNVFSLESNPDKNYYFLYHKNDSYDSRKRFSDIVKKGYKIEKKKGGDKLVVYDSNAKRIEFEILSCCHSR